VETFTPAPISDVVHTRDLVTMHQREAALLRLVGALTRYQGLLQPAADDAELSAPARTVHERTHDAEQAYGYTSAHLEDGLSLDDLIENAELPTWPQHHTTDGR